MITFSTGYKAARYPAGDVRIPYDCTNVAYLRDADPADLVTLKLWADREHFLGRQPEAVIPYLPGAREDHVGAHFGAKGYAEIINSCRLAKVTCIDPHSDVMPALLDNVKVIDLGQLFKHSPHSVGPFYKRYVGVISPDAGATKRATLVGDALGIPVYQAGKRRDQATGKLSGFWCEPLPVEGRFLVVDDICDGGGTFLGLAEATGLDHSRLDLWVTHGAFTNHGAFKDLEAAFGQTFTTDSFTTPAPLNARFVRCAQIIAGGGLSLYTTR